MLIQRGDEVRAPPAADAPSRRERMPDAITGVGGLLVAAIGVTTMVAWFLRVTPILRFGSLNPISFNTSLAFAVTGIALAVFASGWWPRAVQIAGVFDAVLFAVILAEYASGHGLGVDQLIAKAYIVGPHDVPGRPAVNTSACLVLVGVALLVWGPWRRRRRPVVLAAAASVIAVIAVAATFGYATGNPKAYGWTHVTAMAFVTALTMLVLAISLLSAAWRDSHARTAGLPRWLPMPAGGLALGLAAWLLIDGRAVAAGRISAATFTVAATALGLVLTAMVVLVVWVAQQAEGRRLAAVATAAQLANAEAAARESEHRLFQFLDVMPVGVFIASPGGQPYYASDDGERLLGKGVAPDVGSDELAEVYGAFQAGTDRQYPTDAVPIVRALLGHESHVDDMEIHRPDGSVVPLEVWGRPVRGAGGQVDYGIAAFADMSERNAREKTIAGQAALLELAHDAIFVRDLGSRIAYWNSGGEHTYGFTRAEAMDHVSHDLLRTQFPEPIADIEAAHPATSAERLCRAPGRGLRRPAG
jgi:PAS domain-containing protein